MPRVTKSITDGEALWLWRWIAERDQSHVAERFGVCRQSVSAWEVGDRPVPRYVDARIGRDLPPGLHPGCTPGAGFRQHEAGGSAADVIYAGPLAALARRRSGWGLAGVARKAGVSRRTILAWERRGDPRLIRFWSRFTFVRFPG